MNQKLYTQAVALTEKLYERVSKSIKENPKLENYEYHRKVSNLYRKSKERESRRFQLWLKKET